MNSPSVSQCGEEVAMLQLESEKAQQHIEKDTQQSQAEEKSEEQTKLIREMEALQNKLSKIKKQNEGEKLASRTQITTT